MPNVKASQTGSIMCCNLLMKGNSELVMVLEMLSRACSTRACLDMTMLSRATFSTPHVCCVKGVDVLERSVHSVPTAQKPVFVTTLNTVAVFFLQPCKFIWEDFLVYFRWYK